MQNRSTYSLEVNPKLPARLARLEELASNLWYSWDRPTRTLFSRLHPGLWNAIGHSPRAFLRRVDERRLVAAADDPVFLGNFNRVLSAYDTYHNEPLRRNGSEWLDGRDLIAYFCAEFGFHESFPIYSGGLGILAGDHCKTASDMRLPFVGVGLLYRQGYFSQAVDTEGNQQAFYTDSEFESLPIEPASGPEGGDLRIYVDMPSGRVAVKIWRARCGHVQLCLLDTDLPENDPRARNITHQLYGGDRTTRIEQEIILGIGGVRALHAMGLKPTVWHINEGHAAFLVLERMRALTQAGLDAASALEAVGANTVFTTHTPVPAGHDYFDEAMAWRYFEPLCREMGLERGAFLALGRAGEGSEFNMTTLATRGSRHQNGVSRIHGSVSSQILHDVWPQIDPADNPVGYVTNGVHVPTFLASEWSDLFERFLGFDWTQRMTDVSFWKRIDEIPDHLFWSTRQSLKTQMLHLVRYRVSRNHSRNQGSEAHLDRLLRFTDPANPSVLTIGFARRFATYKRATLIFQDLDWLRRLLCNDERPVVLLFAGKAHPADQPGQDLIRRITQVARMPEFEGRILLVEDYDLRSARRLVVGVDVWLNNPIYPLEASGTSGMKAGMNGVINLSVLDGWWDEGYDGQNGWAIKPVSEGFDEGRRNQEEAKILYELLQDHVIPAFYNRGDRGYSPEWVRMSKNSIASLLPRFSSARMVQEYVSRLYLPASRQGRRFADATTGAAPKVARWKAHVRECWNNIRLRRLDTPARTLPFGGSIQLDVAVFLDGMQPQDVVVEMLIARQTGDSRYREAKRHRFEWDGQMTEEGEHRFVLQITPDLCGKLEYRIRVYPHHELLTHPFEMGMMRWL